ncbi:hypothetical protein HPB47_026238 [Ixodes persulcatus]|uniref:Uncharacterized protein n=1 Tax=Ixodes persulcatus TaxID=34615 RepID=A0AC60PZS7_IXOPE|nr:hypothetical protein HPB47_026238 [Ixodes persulcatus]
MVATAIYVALNGLSKTDLPQRWLQRPKSSMPRKVARSVCGDQRGGGGGGRKKEGEGEEGVAIMGPQSAFVVDLDWRKWRIDLAIDQHGPDDRFGRHRTRSEDSPLSKSPPPPRRTDCPISLVSG